MRTLRTVLVVLCLIFVTSTAATAAPMEAGNVESRSLSSWVVAAFDWLLASLSIEEVVAGVESGEPDKSGPAEAQPLEGDEPPDEIGGALEPNG